MRGLPRAYLQVLLNLEIKGGARNACELVAQPIHNFVRGNMSGTLVQRFESDPEVTDVGASAAWTCTANRSRDRLDRRIFQYCLREVALFVAKRWKADILSREGSAVEPACVLLREEALGDNLEQVDVEGNGEKDDAEHDELVPQHPAKSRSVLIVQPLESTLAGLVKGAMTTRVAYFQELSA